VRKLLVGAVLVAIAATVAVFALRSPHSITPGCTVSSPDASYLLDLDQASNAATIAAVGARMGLPDHAVTVALAAASQESKLRNLPYGDRDSVGLFQQRPSQGWGARAQLLDPVFASHAFYAKLARVPHWQTLPVADAAQKVQRSASGDAYAQWEDEARALARALTGEAPSAVACQFAKPASPAATTMDSDMRKEFGRSLLVTGLSERERWVGAAWVVAKAYQYSVQSVRVDALVWNNKSDRWRSGQPATSVVTVRSFPPK
jgi:hypothetical protein